MKQAYIVKLQEDSYDLIVTGLMTAFSIQPLATLNKKSYEMMLECLKGLQIGLGGWYQFPKYPTLNEVQTIIQKYDDDSIVLHLNLGSITLSDMDNLEFEQLIKELEALPMSEIGSKVYFI